jgi:glycosyltransferase involved in cell wall biosynthesis
MKLSVVVIIYNITREAPRTLLSLSPTYQHGITADDYEVIVVENGSTKRLDPEQVTNLGPQFRYFYLDNASPSPASALNFGIQQAKGDLVGIMIDGARICTPGLLHQALAGAETYNRAIVATLGFYLGNGFQRYSIMRGYNQHEEDMLLKQINWPQEGYRLFEAGSRDESSHWNAPLAESNALFMRKELWTELGGIDERFDLPGGGLVNLDTFARACELPNSELVILLGEGTFHQVHNGVATNTPPYQQEINIGIWMTQYREIRGKEYALPEKPRKFSGPFSEYFLSHFSQEISETGSHLINAGAEITRLETLVHSLQADYDRLQTQDLPETRSHLNNARAEISRLESQLHKLHSNCVRLQTVVNTFSTSRSWRITKPLRVFFGALATFRKHITQSMARP